MKRKKRIGSLSDELLHKSREAALSAIQIFNNPLIKFKSETYIVLMVIAWTYLLHAYYRKNKVEYRYYNKVKSRKRFQRIKKGKYKYWELERCLDDNSSPIDSHTANNLRFLIGLRHEIEHQMTRNLDSYLSARYQSCAFNYNRYIKNLFGETLGIDKYLLYSIQFLDVTYSQLNKTDAPEDIPDAIKNYITKFDMKLSDEEFQHDHFSYRIFFMKKMANKPGQADKVIEFISPDSEHASGVALDNWIKKEVERPKYRASRIVELMKGEGFTKFTMHHHTKLWKELEAKKEGKGYGVEVVAGTWLWYESWLSKVRDHCHQHSKIYRDDE